MGGRTNRSSRSRDPAIGPGAHLDLTGADAALEVGAGCEELLVGGVVAVVVESVAGGLYTGLVALDIEILG